MNCKIARGLFSLRLDDGLSYEEQRRLSQHLDSCSNCMEEYRGLERTVGLLHSLPEIEASGTFLQDVLRAARQTQGEGLPASSAPGLWERFRGWASSAVLDPAPRWAVAALALGLVVGISGSILVFHGARAPEVAQQVQSLAIPHPETSVTAEPAQVSPSSMPSGPFEDLVQEMLRRTESGSAGATDSSSTTSPEWGAGWDPAVHGQTVGQEPATTRGRGREGSVYIVF
jgi:anti-sigma factor RsiW